MEQPTRTRGERAPEEHARPFALRRPAGVLLVLTAIGAGASALILAREDGDSLAARKGTLTGVETGPDDGDDDFERKTIDLASDTGVAAECEVRAPRDKSGRYPAVVLLGGFQTGKHAVDHVEGFGGFLILSLEYRIGIRQGGYTALEALADAPAVRRQALDVVPSIMLAADYLVRRPDVDASRLILLGYSFGSLYVPCVAAVDRRFAAAAMVDGGGNLPYLIRRTLEGQYDPVTCHAASLLAGLLLRPVEPMRYAGRIAPRPFIMVNSREDQRIPRACVEDLYEGAHPPKRLLWVDGPHVELKDEELIQRTAHKVVQQLRGLEILR